MSLVVRAGLLVTGAGARLEGGWLRSRHGEIVEVGSGPVPEAGEVLDLPNCVMVAGLVNTHDHMYQWATRGYAPSASLFGWLTELYPVWREIDATTVRAAARAAMARLLLAGCTLTTDHHYVFPAGRGGIFEALVEAGRELGIRFHPCRGSMDLGDSQGGLPPDSVVEDLDRILAETERVVSAFHDPAPGSMLRVAVAPCSPFSVTPRLMTESAALARRLGLHLHTHLAESVDEDFFCREKFGRRPLELLEEWGWLGEDVWLAHGIHLAPAEVAEIGRTRTGVAHCPSSNLRLGSGACPVADLVAAGARVGLGVDGSASNEDYDLLREAHQALLLARLRAAMLGRPAPAAALTPEAAIGLANRGGAAVLGRDDVGTLEVGKRADVALYKVDDLGRGGIADPLAAIALAPPARAEAVVVEGRVVVREGRLLTADEDEVAREISAVSVRLQAVAHR
ncbi:MAG TPA: 8-oxoguanine deaminase [Candidatus Dormibacteraeota bacterium]|nr:8-oxoguanine deaminase [Candidatus Dormibacteraeota bacterium]